MIADIKRLLTGQKKAASSITDGLQELRLRRLRLLDERDQVAARPVPREEAIAALDRDLDDLVDAARDLTNIRSLTRSDAPAWTTPPTGVLLGLLVGANRQAFRDQLTALIEQSYAAGPEPISAQDRAAALQRIDGDVIDTEMGEECMIRASEAAGMPILRRADADPRAVLAADGEFE